MTSNFSGCHVFAHNSSCLLKVLHSLAPPWGCQVQGAPLEFDKSGHLHGPGDWADRTFPMYSRTLNGKELSYRSIHIKIN